MVMHSACGSSLFPGDFFLFSDQGGGATEDTEDTEKGKEAHVLSFVGIPGGVCESAKSRHPERSEGPLRPPEDVRIRGTSCLVVTALLNSCEAGRAWRVQSGPSLRSG